MRYKLRGVSYIVTKRHELWSTNAFKLEASFHPPYINSAFHFIARLHRRRSAYGIQPNFAKWWMVNHANNLPYKSLGRLSVRNKTGEKLLHLFGFQRLQDSLANMCWTKRDTDNRARALESTGVSCIVPKLQELWSTNRTGDFTHPHYFGLSQSIASPLCSINVAPHSGCKWKSTGFVCSSDLKPQKMLNWKCCRVWWP